MRFERNNDEQMDTSFQLSEHEQTAEPRSVENRFGIEESSGFKLPGLSDSGTV